MKRWDIVADGLVVIAVPMLAVQLGVNARLGPNELIEGLLLTVACLPSLVLGAVVARRRPANAVGPVLTLVGFLPLVAFALEAWGATTTWHDPWPGAQFFQAAAMGSWMWLYVGPISLALIFPTGTVLSCGWRAAAGACVAIPLSFEVVGAQVLPEPANVVLATVLLLGLLALLVASVVCVALRYRHGDDELRRQLRWLAVTAVLAPAALLVCWASYLIAGTADAVGVALTLLFIALPVSVTIAMLRHNLYGYDRLLSGTVRWVAIVSALGAVFGVITLSLGLVLGGDSPVVAAGATLVCALGFRPLYRGLRRAIDSRFQPGREQAIRAVSAFVGQVRDGIAAPEELESVLRRSTGDPLLRVELAESSASIVPGPRRRVTDADLRDIEHESRLPLELVRLRKDLRHALEQTEASRGRILEAADEERRRIQRDLHDGAQQNLVAVGMRLRAFQRSAVKEETARELGEAVKLVQRTIADLRRLAQGIRPSSLDDGLEPALRAMVRAVSLRVDLELEPIVVKEPSATAAYYVAAEAVTNSLKHASASRIGISLARHSGGVRLLVLDDGRGGASSARGTGLAGIRDRVEAAGGRLTVESPSGAGTRVEALLP